MIVGRIYDISLCPICIGSVVSCRIVFVPISCTVSCLVACQQCARCSTVACGATWRRRGCISTLTHTLQRLALYFLNSSSLFSGCIMACVDLSLITVPVTPYLSLYLFVTITQSPIARGLFLFRCCVTFVSTLFSRFLCLCLICHNRFCILHVCISNFTSFSFNSSISVSLTKVVLFYPFCIYVW